MVTFLWMRQLMLPFKDPFIIIMIIINMQQKYSGGKYLLPQVASMQKVVLGRGKGNQTVRGMR